VKIRTIDEKIIRLLVSGYRIKFYKKPIKREEFTSLLQSQQINVVGTKNSPNHYNFRGPMKNNREKRKKKKHIKTRKKEEKPHGESLISRKDI